MKKVLLFLLLMQNALSHGQEMVKQHQGIELLVLGTVQDAGSPHIACQKSCCASLSESEKAKRMVVSLGLLDHESGKKYLLDASPDMPAQLELMHEAMPGGNYATDGIFLTHAHIGHYTGLMYLGREAMNARRTKVYTMPKLREYLRSNGPWEQLVKLNNIVLMDLRAGDAVSLSKELRITPLLVPHRDEYSETVGFLIAGPEKKALFIPDIDKWKHWERDIVALIREVDYAFVDATFYDQNELPNRDMAEIPHPFVVESMALFEALPREERAKVQFIHLNHSNPLLRRHSEASARVRAEGYGVARLMDSYNL